MLGVAAQDVLDQALVERPGETPEVVILVNKGIKGIIKSRVKVAQIEAYINEQAAKTKKEKPAAPPKDKKPVEPPKEPEKAAEDAPIEPEKAAEDAPKEPEAPAETEPANSKGKK